MTADEREIDRIASWYLNGLLADSVQRTDVRPEAFHVEAVENAAEILTQSAYELEHRDELRERLAVARWRLASQAMVALTGVVAAAAALLDLTPAVYVAALVAAGLTLVMPILGYRRARGQSLRGLLGGPMEPFASLQEKCRAAEQAASTALRRAVLEWLSARIDLALGEIYNSKLPALNPTGLAEIDDEEREISTATTERLEATIARMPAGSIGVAGPRGAGKTTLLRRITRADPQGTNEPEADGGKTTKTTGLVVDAPVEYDAREFILHLFARLCERVLGSDRVNELRGWNRAPTVRLPLVGAAEPAAVGAPIALAGLIVYLAILGEEGDLQLADLRPFAVVAIVLGGFLIYITMLGDLPAWRRWLRILRSNASAARSPAATAEIRLRQIWYQQSVSTGWSGGLRLPFGLSAGAERGTQLAEKQLSLPDIVALYKEFVGLVAAEGQVRIGIDELDKMDDERARRFLNEIKVIFRTENCFYLVSVSEDAMSYFERRGLPFRDVFDSSFDEVMQVGYLPYEHSHRLLRKRVVGLPLQFVALCHVLGGGLARDVIRVAREVCGNDEGTDIRAIATTICRRQVRAKCDAARVAMRRLRDPEQIALLGRWLRELRAEHLDTAAMLRRCRAFGADLIEPLGPPPRDDPECLKDHREAMSIALEVIAFVYFVVSLGEFLPTLESEAGTRAAMEKGTVEALAEARQAFAHNPSEAWEAVSALRQDPLRAEVIEFPRRPM